MALDRHPGIARWGGYTLHMRFLAPPVLSRRSTGWLLSGMLACTSALAQWQWLDASGRKVYSDTPPPINVPEKDILRRAGPTVAAPAAGPVPAANPSAAPQISGRDGPLEARKKQAEAQEQAQKKAEADKLAQIRQDNCERARRGKATLESGVRMVTTNAQGEREVMDDAARAAETQRINEIIRSSCFGNAP